MTLGLHPAKQPWARAEGPFPGTCITSLQNPAVPSCGPLSHLHFPSPVYKPPRTFQEALLFCFAQTVRQEGEQHYPHFVVGEANERMG